MKWHPRNDFVLIRIDKVVKAEDELAFSDHAIQGKEFVVEAMGPLVEGLEIGDKVMMLGNLGATFFELPNDRNRIAIKQEHVVLVLEG